MTATSAPPTKVGVVGLGMAGSDILRSLARQPGIDLAAVVSSREEARSAFADQYHGRSFSSLEELCRDPEIEAVWVATPSEYHAEHAITLMNHGKHVVVEKPFATTLADCERMIEAAERNKVVLIAGGSHSFNPAFLSMRKIVASGRLGRLGGLTNWAFNSWMVAAREPHEVDPDRDGGELLNQGPHVVDALRLIAGGMVRSVRGTAIDLNLPGRPCPGHFTAFLEFEDGTPATLVYDGYGYLSGWELVPWGETPQRLAGGEGRNAYRKQLRNGIEDEYQARSRSRFRANATGPRVGGGAGPWVPGSPGLVIANCELGAIRQSSDGLYVYDDEGRHEEPFSVGGDVRSNEAAELRRGLAGQPIFRDGRWGMATLEVVLAIADSGATHAEITMKHQVPVVDGIDD